MMNVLLFDGDEIENKKDFIRLLYYQLIEKVERGCKCWSSDSVGEERLC
jgi:hypothetical protein